MAWVVNLGDAAALGLSELAGVSFPCSQSSTRSKFQGSIGWPHWGRNGAAVLSKKLACGKPLFESKKPRTFKPAAALPLDRKSYREGGEAGASDELDSEPWVGAVVFKRSAVRTHYEFQTSLERLGLGFLSTDSSRALASAMGLRSASSPGVTEESTPVNISIDASRDEESRDLRLDGIARTTLGLCCNRCMSPLVERIFAGFSLLLTEKPVIEPSQQRIGVVLGESGPANDGQELDLELDDKLHFPREAKEIDLSKYLRDSVHLEIPFKSLCSIQCVGLCPTCGGNLNKGKCGCTAVDVKPSWGPLDQLKRQLKDEEGLQ